MDQQQATTNQITIFYSYAHTDERLRKQLETHLSLLRQQGIILEWYDRQIVAGTDWAHEMDVHLTTARVILLLISPDFIASDYCYGVELQRAMERHDTGEAHVIPIVLRPVADWDKAPFARLAVLPTNRKPITRWRHRDDAWADVVAGICRAIEELPRLAAITPRTALPPVWNIPYPRNPVFTGREELLERLARSLRAGQAMAISQPQAISGLGGIGKTQLAVEYAYRHRHDYQAVLWTRADSREALISAFVAISELFNLPEKDVQEQMIAVNAVKAWLQKYTGWLLILDNADDLAIIPAFLPPTYGGHILLTTRGQAMGRLAQRIEVDTLLADVGALFLLRRAGLLALNAPLDQAIPADQEVAKQTTEELGGLPLALDQAGAYIEETGCSLADYQQLYQRRRAKLLKERGGLVTDHPESVATTVSIAVQRVEWNNPAAADLLRFCAFLAPDAIPEEILTEGATELGPVLAPIVTDAFRLNEAIAALRAYSLISRDPQAQTLTVHRLVQVVLRDSMPIGTQQQWMQRAIHAVEAAYPGPDIANWPTIERLLPHVLTCATWIEQTPNVSPKAPRLLNQAGYYLQERARYAEAEPLYQRALSICEQELGAMHPSTAGGLNNLAGLYKAQGRYSEAESLYQRALSIREQVLGAMHPNTATSLNNLAELYTEQGMYGEAEPLYQRALSIFERVLGQEHPITQTVHENYALLRRTREHEKKQEG